MPDAQQENVPRHNIKKQTNILTLHTLITHINNSSQILTSKQKYDSVLIQFALNIPMHFNSKIILILDNPQFKELLWQLLFQNATENYNFNI